MAVRSKKPDFVFLFTYKDAMKRDKYMAIYADDKKSAMTQFIANKLATDRLIGEAVMTPEQYREWKKNL